MTGEQLVTELREIAERLKRLEAEKCVREVADALNLARHASEHALAVTERIRSTPRT